MTASAIAVFAVLKVVSSDASCPREGVILERLVAQGVVVPPARVEVRFAREPEAWVATITTEDAAPRRLESRAESCASLADATVALLAVLFDETPDAPAPAPAPAPPPVPPTPRVRAEASLLGSTGIVADVALGAAVGVAWVATPSLSLGLLAETWPAREHAAEGGRVSVAASSFALVACAEHRPSIALSACALGHAGFYSLTADGFDVVHPETRALLAVEGDARVAFPLSSSLAVFVRAGLWVPFTRLDVTVTGSDAGFRTTSFGTKGGLGLELRR